jgi:cation:H+ antiporter
MVISLLALLVGFILLVWSADRFVDGASATAAHFGVPSLIIGILIVGFGTSAPEMLVSTMAALDGNPDLALGNAIGSNITNTGLIIGLTAIITPLTVHSGIVKKELPLLLGICFLLGAFLADDSILRWEAGILMLGFFGLLAWSVYSGLKERDDSLGQEVSEELEARSMPLRKALMWLIVGMLIMIGSSRLLVYGAVNIATFLGISDLIIGLTIVALGTSLPELAASVMAARKGEHDIALGNVVGSNMFNLLAVIGIAGLISPMPVIEPAVLYRDWLSMVALIVMLLFTALGFGKQGRINRIEGAMLLIVFAAYNTYLLQTILKT